MNENPQSEGAIFCHAIGLSPAEREAYLDQACGADDTLRARIESLLQAHNSAGSLLESAPGLAVRANLVKPTAPDESPGTVIGRYKLLQKIGEGGCGVVYMAEQQEPVVRRVALKVIKLGMDTREVIARFEAERQALALMDHPNIARVYDAGATETGRPYFVMELVRGVRITDYCDQHNLPTADRLNLFTQVCHAIQHAHQKGVVHRDIKPSNVLVTVIDGSAVPKVIDFGIAKAAQGRLVDRTLFTAFEQFIGTPAYMSPEQAEMSGVEIDARSDIYSLGVLLYELLTGRPPFEPQDLLQVGLDAMRQRIRKVEPPRPSTRLSTLEVDALSLTALQRNVAASRLIHSVRGDLDWIAMKCLEKDRGRRYDSAASLAEDVQRHLENQPVSARRPSLFYRGSKFARRHRAGLLLVGGVLSLGVLGWKFWSVGTVANTPPRTATVAANTVGPRGNPNTIDISGNRDFSAGAIREGLGHDDSFIQAAHSEAPLDELVAVTQQAILRGYRSLGYLHTTVTVTHNPDQARLKVAITEGRRYRRGDVQVLGLTEADSAKVIELLTKPPPLDEAERAEEAVTSFLTQEADIQQGMAQIESLLSDTPTGLRAVSKVRPSANAQPEIFVTPSYRPRHALWERETPAPFTGDYLQEVVAEIRVWLDRKGFSTAEIQAEVQPDETKGLASLQVRIQEGPRAVLGPVKVTGNQRNTAEEIIRCAGLTSGQKLDSSAIARARLALWNSARFYEFSLKARPTSPDGGICEVDIDVNECEVMPLLRESLSREQQALVRFANWVTTETRRREFKMNLGDPGCSIVMTPENGSAVYTEDPKTGALLALLIRPDGIRLFGSSDAGSTGLDICRLAIRPTAFLHIFTTRGPERHGNMTMGMGLTRDRGPNDADGFTVVLAPLVACKDLAAQAVSSFANGDVILRIGNEGSATTLRFREDTGQLLSMDKLNLKDVKIDFQVGGSDFARVTQRADQEWNRLPFDPAQRMSLAELLLHTNLRTQFAKTEVAPPDLRWAAVFLRVSERLLATPEFRTWLNPASLRDDPPFTIPADVRHGMPNGDVMASLGRNLHQFARVFTPPQAWPARLMREIPYLIEGHSERSAAMFSDLWQDPDMGPIGSLLAAKLMFHFNQPGAWRFARRAVEHGSVEEFRQDYHTLLEGDSTVARMIQTALPALASMSDEETDQITAGWPEAETKFWRQAVSLFRGMKAEGVVSALRPELENWWAQEMQPHLTERIGRFLEPSEPIPALVAATVNGRAIRRTLLAAVRRNPRLLTAVPPEIPAADVGQSGADRAFENLVLLTLVREEAIAHGADDSAATIDRRLEQIIREQFREDRKAFETMLGREGLTVDDFRQLTLLNDAYAGLLQSIGQPASTAAPANPRRTRGNVRAIRPTGPGATTPDDRGPFARLACHCVCPHDSGTSSIPRPLSEQSSREEELFAGALALAPDQRATYLAQVCDRDATLRTRLEALLQANDSANNPLDAAPGAVVRDALAKPPDESPGAMIGRYKLLQKIGEGGCGVVYMAEQREPVVRRVALKVIKLGMDTREVIARFEAERQALAMMDHPNIARVFDAGATDQGRPFFVMELVRGIPIVKYCDEQKLPTRTRIELFTQICQAVQHAHQKGIIHRDLKPSNILVTLQDGVPVPKVIDFGIAKATQGRLTDRTLFTAFEQFVGTPAYMSPEQAELSSVDVDTRSDIYSLGVLLYELLTGRTPFETTDLLKAGLDEMRRQIREVEPPKPSTRLRTLEAETLSVTARHHAIGPPRLIHLVRGDLDWIVMKCLEKDRARRYETAASLAQDLAHFLADEPVLAAAPTAWYKLRKLTRRHRTLVITGISFAVALVAVAVGSAVLAFRASRLERAATEARREAEATSRTAREAAAVGLAVEEFLRVHLLAGTGGATRDETALCDRLDRATAQLRDQPPANPLVEIAIRENLAAGYRSLGLHTSLQAQLARITDLYQRQRGASDAQTIQASRNLQLALAETNNPPTRELPPLPPASNESSPPPPVVPEATVALPVTTVAAPAAANPAPPENPPVLQPLVINLGTFLPHGTTQERLVLRMAESWRTATEGKITLRVFSDGRAGNESEIVTLVENRKLQAALMTVVGMEEIENGVVGLQKITLGYSSLAEFDYVAEHLTPELEARLQRKGLTVLFWSDGGWMQLFSRHPVESPADLKALRLYMWAGRPAHVEIMRRAGFKPVPLEVGDYISAFRNGLIDAGSLPPFLALSYQIDSYAPHMLLLNSEPLIGVCVIRRDTWESIPPETRERLLAIARATGREITASARRESDAAIAAMQKRNLTVHTVPAAAAAEWHAIAQEFRPLIRGRIVDPVIYDRVQALIAEYRLTHPGETTVP